MNRDLKLDYQRIIKTIQKLESRIGDRFPDSGLKKVGNDLLSIANETAENIKWVSKPLIWLRGVSYFIIAVGIVGIIYSFTLVQFDEEIFSFTSIVALSEAAINDLILIGAAIFFLITLENRVKRSKTVKALNELRAVAHVIDMHQLTKDPHIILNSNKNTSNSPNRSLTAYELQRYLDYSSEMLALIGKIAALYSQHFEDDVVVRMVNEIEVLTTGLSRKIWQKLIILNDLSS